MNFRKTIMAALLAAGLAPAAADAAIISGTYSFTFTGFNNGFPNLTGTVTLSFDNSASITNSTAGITSAFASWPDAGGIGFSYVASRDELVFGGLTNGVTGLAAGTLDFGAVITNASTSPVAFDACLSSDVTIGCVLTRPSGTVTFTPAPTPPPTAVPEPAALALLGAGLAGLGLAARRRRAATRPA